MFTHKTSYFQQDFKFILKVAFNDVFTSITLQTKTFTFFHTYVSGSRTNIQLYLYASVMRKR